MRVLVEHLLRCNRDQILARSFRHCHTPNMHSIMLLESPGRTIRLFVAEPGHQLADNFPENFQHNRMSVSFHPHHCETTLVPLYGKVYNWCVDVRPNTGVGLPVMEHHYRSPITHPTLQVPVFTPQLPKRVVTVSYDALHETSQLYLSAHEVHTVAVPQDQWAAWYVLEGREREDVDSSICWTNRDLRGWIPDYLYKPMQEDDLNRLLGKVFYVD